MKMHTGARFFRGVINTTQQGISQNKIIENLIMAE